MKTTQLIMKHTLIYIAIGLAVAAAGALFAFSKHPKDPHNEILMSYLYQDDYEKAWREIDSLDQKGLPKSALEKVEKLHRRAVQDNNAPQIIKALLYRGKYTAYLEEDGRIQAIYDLNEEIEQAPSPSKEILQSIVAQLYQRYMDENHWRFNGRSDTEDFEPSDIRTWSLKRLQRETARLYQASASNKMTRKVAIGDFAAITTKFSERNKFSADLFRPSLYDLLAHRAIDYFMNKRSYLSEPSNTFYVEDAAALGSVEAFIKHPFKSGNPNDNKYRTLLLLQDLLTFHNNDKDPAALIDADLKRLKFAYQYSISPDKDTQYGNALQALSQKYNNHPSRTEVDYLIAKRLMAQGDNAPSGDDTHKWAYKEALAICDKAIADFPKAYGTHQCGWLRSDILHKNIEVDVEAVNVSDTDFPILVKYRNVDKIWYSVVRIPNGKLKKYREMKHDERQKYIVGLPVLQQGEQALKNDGDYRSHSTELKIDALPYGTYVVMASDNPERNTDGGALADVLTTVSNIGYHLGSNRKGEDVFYLFDRKTGAPASGVIVDYYFEEYKTLKRRYEYAKKGTLTSDKDGRVAIPGKNKRYKVILSKGEDFQDLNDGYYGSQYHEPRHWDSHIGHFFLDRQIYRPGQTIHFKALPLKKDGTTQKPELLPNKKFAVIFSDANLQVVKRLDLTSNEYGTISGKFQAPQSGMLGNMRLRLNDNNGVDYALHYFKVEEYKRPKFEVTFDKPEKGYKLDDKITLTGNAKAFAGNNIDNAKVSYRVVREARFPYWRWWWRPAPSSPDQEITFGETATDENGQFNVTFEAIPDRSIPKDKKPIFSYTVYADVVDITGETRSGNISVRVGTIALEMGVDVPKTLELSDLDSFGLSSTNLSGKFEAAKGNVVIQRLVGPEQPLVARYWETPDFPIINKEDFKEYFPDRPYKNEDKVEEWLVGKTVLSESFNTKVSKKVTLDKNAFEQGQYKLTLKTQDRYGQEIELERYFEVIDSKAKKTPGYQPFSQLPNKTSFQPGETLEVEVGSAYRDAKFLLEVEHDGQLLRKEWLSPKENQTIKIPIKEEYRGGLGYRLNMVHNNRAYSHAQLINVPWSNKDLKIEYATFRDKLYPGQEEEWQVKISGPKGDKVTAEMVAAMYDASLDEFAPNHWSMGGLYPTSGMRYGLDSKHFNYTQSYLRSRNWQVETSDHLYRRYRNLEWFGFPMNSYMARGGVNKSMLADKRESAPVTAAPPSPSPSAAEAAPKMLYDVSEEAPVANNAEMDGVGKYTRDEDRQAMGKGDFSGVKVRTNLDETVFFFPNLATDAEGNIIIKFTMNEALTEWKFLGMAHTKKLEYATTEKRVKTQKDLMVMPNAPRFFRQGDRIQYTAKVSNLTAQDMNGTAALKLFDAITNEPIDMAMGNTKAQIPFSAKAGQSAPLAWELTIPKDMLNPVTHRVVAKSGGFSDGEEAAIPVLSNRMMVTESLPLPVRGGQTKEFTLAKLKDSGHSPSLQNHRLTLEFTSNPAWYAVQALPYLMEYPYDCTEQIFSRYYANSLATTVANAHPNIRRVFDSWKDTEALESNLSKNQELKYAILEDTPWVMDAQNEAQQKKNIGLLFDLNRMSEEQDMAMAKITERQLDNGGFSWFPGGRDNWYITQYLVEGMGHLDRLGVKDIRNDKEVSDMMRRAVKYCDDRLLEMYGDLKKAAKEGNAKMEDDHLNAMAIHYLYSRSFFNDVPMNDKVRQAADYYVGQAGKYWLDKGIYQEGMIALALHRKGGHAPTTSDIVKSLRERSLNDEEMGMYWKYNTGYHWYQLPIETHALMIECFDEVAKDEKAVDDLKVWLLKNKQTNNWKTTKATASAVYAMLMRGDNWLLEDKDINITIGGKTLDQSSLDKEAGTGYFKTQWSAEDITPKMAEVTVENPNKVVAWGAMYWQYMEDLDKITSFEETPLTIRKELFVEENTQNGPALKPITRMELQPGDKLKVRIEIRVDRDMEYVHMKDARAAGLEPINAISQYKWQDGLGYYESTRDASTDFFFSQLPKGTYVFEYPLRVQLRGNFSNGVTTIQCMYAPEFTSHSEGIRVKVE